MFPGFVGHRAPVDCFRSGQPDGVPLVEPVRIRVDGGDEDLLRFFLFALLLPAFAVLLVEDERTNGGHEVLGPVRLGGILLVEPGHFSVLVGLHFVVGGDREFAFDQLFEVDH